MSKMTSRQRQWVNYVIPLLVIILASLVYVHNSPLYKGNQWVDTNAMLTLGQAWLQGHVPLRDIFEQRGPILYLYYLIANVISSRGYFGLFVIECLNLYGIWYWSRKILRLFAPTVSTEAASGISLTLPLLLLGSFSFEDGGSPEELMLFWILWALYLGLRYFKLGKLEVRNGVMLGVSFAVVFWTKYTLVGTWIALIVLFTVVAWARKQWRIWWQTAISFTVGASLVSGIILGYFAVVHGLNALIHVYFTVNMTAYASPAGGKRERLWEMATAIHRNVMAHPYGFALFVAAAVVLLFFSKEHRPLVGTTVAVIGVNLILSYWSLRTDPYVFLITVGLGMVLVAPALMVIGDQLQNKRLWLIAVGITVLMLPAFGNRIALSGPYIWSNQPFAAADFGAYISKHETKPVRVLYYNGVDMGISRFTNVVHDQYYFEHTNLSITKYPAQSQSERDTVAHKRAKYVVWTLTWGNKNQFNLANRQSLKQFIPKDILKNYRIVKVGSSRSPLFDGVSGASIVGLHDEQYVLLKAR
ncbi:hypothetical protein [Furfurilactobacillus entadae]|uniref:hypothetical protein n=1 Tax=Furfurilactobacillus entadae TaxID=2922307 RepID=UPI0035E513B3